MSQLLYIQASPRGERSFSIAVANAVVDSYRKAHPKDSVAVINLFQKELPSFDGFTLNAKYAILNGMQHTADESAAWEKVVAVAEEFKAADKYILATPMWNFGIPYRLKQYFDVLIQPTLTFSFSPETGYTGLVTGKPAVVVCARGGEYPPGSPMEAWDFQAKYVQTLLGFIGFTDVQTLVVEPTLGDPAAAGKRREEAIAKARALADSF